MNRGGVPSASVRGEEGPNTATVPACSRCLRHDTLCSQGKRHRHKTETLLRKRAADLGFPAGIASSVLRKQARGEWFAPKTQQMITHLMLLARHPQAHDTLKGLPTSTLTPRTQWVPLLKSVVAAQHNLVKGVEQAAKEQQAKIIQEWMVTRHKHVMENSPYKSLKWLNTKQRPKGEVHSVWSSPSTHAECVKFGCVPLVEPPQVTCTRCAATLHASALPDDIGAGFSQHYQTQFRHRPPLPSTLFSSEAHPTNPDVRVTVAKSVEDTLHLTPEERQFSHIYSPPSEETQHHYQDIMEDIGGEEWDKFVTHLANSAPGPTKYSYALLKHSPPGVREAMRALTALCLCLQDVPEQYKKSLLLPIPKVNGASQVNQFRPIALAEIGIKLLTGLLTQRITNKAKTAAHPLFNAAQFGGVAGRSTEDALLMWHNILDTCRNSGTPLHAFYADVSAAYDSVSTESKTLSYWKAGLPKEFCLLMAAMDHKAEATVLVHGTQPPPFNWNVDLDKGTQSPLWGGCCFSTPCWTGSPKGWTQILITPRHTRQWTQSELSRMGTIFGTPPKRAKELRSLTQSVLLLPSCI